MRERIAPPPARRRSGVFRLVLKLGLIIVLLPLLLTLVYRYVPPVSTLMLYERAAGHPVERDWVPLEAMAPSLVNSVVMSEDGRFCSHDGVDWQELNKVIEEFDERPRGASTIAMQTVKNLFLWNSRSFIRKAIEIPLALYADAVLGKRRVMEIYLNIAEFGPGLFGAEAAARHYFGVPAAGLSAAQAALLTAALPNPQARDPGAPSANLRARADTVAERARQAGGYTDCLAR